MTFEEFSEALRAEGFYRKDNDLPGGDPSFIRPLTGEILVDSSRGGLRYACVPNGADEARTWYRAHEALAMVYDREV